LCVLEAKGGKEVEVQRGRSSRREKLRFRSRSLQRLQKGMSQAKAHEGRCLSGLG